MKAKIRYLYAKLRCSVWLVPSLLVLFSIASAFLFPYLELHLDPNIINEFVSIKVSGDTARSILWIISTTFLAVSCALISVSAMILARTTLHYGSALLRTYLKSQIHQIVIGSALGCFIYSMIIVAKIDTGKAIHLTLSTNIAIWWALCNLGLFIYFLNYTLVSIQATKLVSILGNELHDQMLEYLSELNSHKCSDIDPFQDKKHLVTILSFHSGYLQAVDYDKLIRLSHKYDLYFALTYRQGQFIFTNTPLVEIYGVNNLSASLEQKLRGAFLTGFEGLPEQDLEFRVRQLVILAVRSLARGVNDTNTCLHCIDFLAETLLEASLYQLTTPIQWSYKGVPRVIQSAVTFEGLMDAAFNQIRQNAPNNPAVIIRLLERLSLIAARAHPANRKSIKKHAQLIFGGYVALAPKDHDWDDVHERYVKVMKALMIPEEIGEWLTNKE